MAKILTKQEIVEHIEVLLRNHQEVKDIYISEGGAIRVDLNMKDQMARERIALFLASQVEGASISPNRPADVKNFFGSSVLVKPKKGATAAGASINYGLLQDLDISEYDTLGFKEVSDIIVGGKLPKSIKEASDVLCVSSVNEAIVKAGATIRKGIDIQVGRYTFKNVIGCVPVTNGEPKADVVLVCKDGKRLYPDCYISYKMGYKPSDFQNLSGLSNKASPYIFSHKETLQFFKLLHALQTNKNNTVAEPFVIIKDNTIKAHAIWGMNFRNGTNFGVNNCHMIAQGKAHIVGSKFEFSHQILNGDMSQLIGEQTVVFGARKATGRGAQGPGGINITGFRIGIFFRAYRGAWVRGKPTI